MTYHSNLLSGEETRSGEYGEPPQTNIPLSFFVKIRKILMPSKSFDKKSDKNLMIFVVGGGVEPPAHGFQTAALPKPRRVTELPQPNVLQR